MPYPSTAVSRLADRQNTERAQLDALLDSTPLVTVAFVRDGHPVALPIGAVRLGGELVIHGSTGSPWLRELAAGTPVSVCASIVDGVMVARSGFESSFRYRSAVLFGTFSAIDEAAKVDYLQELLDVFIPGRSTELRASTSRELAATLVLTLPIGADNWSVKIADGWPEDSDEDVAAGGWAGVVPVAMHYGDPLTAPDCDPAIPIPASVRSMTGVVSNHARA
jgi:nitroimidazol reductase NimA-like FMN-containing flavoprotein (pyridoxamine 5'-phosphate oxidase superfamily)